MKSILFFGDSLVFGSGDSEYLGGWVGRLKLKIENRDGYWCLYNLGIPGGEKIEDVSNRMLTETQSRFKQKYEDDEVFIVVAIGVNNAADDEMSDLVEANGVFDNKVLNLINIARKYTKKIIWVGPLLVDEKKVARNFGSLILQNKKIKVINDRLKKINKKEKIPYFDAIDSWRVHVTYLGEDGIHPTNKGYKVLADKIFRFINEINLLGE